MRRFPSIPVLLLGLCLRTAAGQDAAPTPASRSAEVRAAMPDPSAEAGFTFEADIVVEDAKLGTATYAARPLVEGTTVRWEVLESADIPGGDPSKSRRHATRAVLGRDLRLASYERTVSGPSGPLEGTRVTWADGDRLQVVRTDAGRHETTTAEVADRGAMATLVGLVLFLRRVPAEAAAYDVPIFVHGVGAVRVVRVEVEVPPASGATPALAASAVMEGVTVRVELAGRERRPWRIVQRKGPGTVVFSERSAAAEPAAEPVDASTPAATPREPGVRFLVGVMTGDEPLVASVFHWPSLLAAEKAKSGFSGDEAALRKDVLERLTATYQSVPRAEAERKARTAAAAGAEEADGDRVRVRFGEPLARLSYVAKSFGGAWYVVEMLPVR